MIIKASSKDIDGVTKMAIKLWGSHDYNELKEEIMGMIESNDCDIFVAMEENNMVGFLISQLRYDYVEGTKHSPVGYLEGIFIEEPYRNNGIARDLVNEAMIWAKDKGCLEFASDCEMTNLKSYEFHKAIGFEEVNRIICFKRNL